MAESGIFEIINGTRGIKRLKSDPVPLEQIQKALDAGTKAPSGVNTQPWQFVVVFDRGPRNQNRIDTCAPTSPRPA